MKFTDLLDLSLHNRVMGKKEKGFDKHRASAYLIALKGLGMLNDIK